jgi:hypothetical protein
MTPTTSLGAVRFVALLGAALATACKPTAEPATVNQPAAVAPALAASPVVEAPMDRVGLLQAVAKAASAAALGQDDVAVQRSLDGRRFEIRLRFACPGPAREAESPLSAAFDEKTNILRVRAAPDVSRDDPFVATLGGADVEAVEGFWLRRPWLVGDGCPVLPVPSTPEATNDEGSTDDSTSAKAVLAQPGVQRVGIAQFFSTSDARTGRRDGRPYEVTRALAADAQPSAQGYALILSGRLRQLPDGRVISCKTQFGDAPPPCLVSATIDRVAIANPQTNEELANWSR